jgi:uncharacterized repeat protein (TIGR01451 family)
MRKIKFGTAVLICLLCLSTFVAALSQVYAVQPPGVGKPDNPGKPDDPGKPIETPGAPGGNPSITVEISVKDGADWIAADTAPGPTLASGPVEFKVLVTNTGDAGLMKISITESVSNTVTELKSMAVAETWEKIFSVAWASGQQVYSASVECVYHGALYSDVDSAYYVGLVPDPSIQVVKTTNLNLALVGEIVTYTFTVTNTGNVALSGVSVEDSVTGTANYQSGDANSNGYLDLLETWLYTDTWVVESSPAPLVNTVTAGGYYNGVQYTDTDSYSLDVSEGLSAVSLTSDNIEAGGNFGEGVAIGDGYIAVGAYSESIDPDVGPWATGRVYVYDATTRETIAELISPNAKVGGYFGWVVEINAGYLLVGAPYEDGAGSEDSLQGAAYVYSLADIADPDYEPLQLTSPIAYAMDDGEFGIALASDGTNVFVGATSEIVDGVEEAGAVHVFALSDGTYVGTYAEPHNTNHDGEYGCAVVVYGSQLFVGDYHAEQLHGDTLYPTGAVYVYDLATTNLLETIRSPMYSNGGGFGVSIAVTDDYIVVGAYSEFVWTDTSVPSPGLVHIFDASSYAELDVIESPNPTPNGRFGLEVATDGTYLVVSAYHEGMLTWSGKTYVYTLSDVSVAPIVLASPNAEDTGYFGTWYSVDISDGTVVIGAPNENVGTDIDAGRAYIFSLEA